MASKLDELMALADAFWEHGTNEVLAHAEGIGYDGEKVNAARAALQDALKAVVEDAERMEWLLDGNGYFMEEKGLCGCRPCDDDEKNASRKRIDAARKL